MLVALQRLFIIPVIAPGLAGTPDVAVMLIQLDGLVPQAFEAVTQIFPEDAVLEKLIIMEVVPCPLVMVAPDGVVQL